MLDRALDFIKTHDVTITGQLEYLNDFSWTPVTLRKDREKEHALHNKILVQLVDKIKHVKKESGDSYYTDPQILEFSEKILVALNNHVDRVNEYLLSERWQDYESSDEKSEEIDFQTDIFKQLVLRKDEITKYSSMKDDRDLSIPVYGTVIFSIPMKSYLEERYEDIKAFLDKRTQ